MTAARSRWRYLPEESEWFDPLFQAVTEATEEAVLNSLFNATTVVGHNGARYEAFPIERLGELIGTEPEALVFRAPDHNPRRRTTR